MTLLGLGMLGTLAGCRGCGESSAADAGGGVSAQPPMPKGMLAPVVVSDAAPSSTNTLRIARHQDGGEWTELQVAEPGDDPERTTFEHWRVESRFVSLSAMTLLQDPFVRALPGFDLFMPRLFDRAALARLRAELLTFKQTWSAIATVAQAKARWSFSSFVRELPETDAAWLAARGDLAATIEEIVALCRELEAKGKGLWVLGV